MKTVFSKVYRVKRWPPDDAKTRSLFKALEKLLRGKQKANAASPAPSRTKRPGLLASVIIDVTLELLTARTPAKRDLVSLVHVKAKKRLEVLAKRDVELGAKLSRKPRPISREHVRKVLKGIEGQYPGASLGEAVRKARDGSKRFGGH